MYFWIYENDLSEEAETIKNSIRSIIQEYGKRKKITDKSYTEEFFPVVLKM